MTNTKLSLKKENLVDVAKQYNTKKTLPMVVLLVFLMVLPSVIGIVFASPTEMYGRYNNFLFDEALYNLKNYVTFDDLNIQIEEDEYGYVKNIKINEEKSLGYEAVNVRVVNLEINDATIESLVEGIKIPTFIIGENAILYDDVNTRMLSQHGSFLADDFYNIDFEEIFDTIYLYNGYFTNFLPIMLVLIMVLCLVIIIFFYLALGLSFNFYAKEFKLKKSEMYKLLLFNSIIPVLICFFIGLILPTVHIFFCQMMITYNMYVSIKAKDKELIKERKKRLKEEENKSLSKEF